MSEPITYNNVTFSIGGVSMEDAGSFTFESKGEAESAGYRGVERHTASISVSTILPDGAMEKLLDAVMPKRPPGATPETLQRRVFFGGRKGRRAFRRLMAEFGMAMINDHEMQMRLRAVHDWREGEMRRIYLFAKPKRRR